MLVASNKKAAAYLGWKPEYSGLDDIIQTMDENEKEIYYVWGISREAIEKNPNIEYFKKKGLTLLYLTDPVDEFHMQHLREYKDKNFTGNGN